MQTASHFYYKAESAPLVPWLPRARFSPVNNSAASPCLSLTGSVVGRARVDGPRDRGRNQLRRQAVRGEQETPIGAGSRVYLLLRGLSLSLLRGRLSPYRLSLLRGRRPVSAR